MQLEGGYDERKSEGNKKQNTKFPCVNNRRPLNDEEAIERNAINGQVHKHAGSKNITYPPLNRPSVRQATSIPRPAPMMRLVGLSISGIPRYKPMNKKASTSVTVNNIKMLMAT